MLRPLTEGKGSISYVWPSHVVIYQSPNLRGQFVAIYPNSNLS